MNSEVIIAVPSKFELSQNYPNPFNPSTRINYQLPNDGNVKISVFDNSGKEVMTLANGFKTAGYYSVDMNASALSSGVYFYHLTAGDFSAVKKMLLVK
ncbi:MAG: T9SS type A sorting domain-containing protein [Ignavibacteria bacterium]|nr:T9SS type A sorting domain-containing protein [Ignavibacteria bacterium]